MAKPERGERLRDGRGGEEGIRTLDGLLAHTPLAGERLRPLGHLSTIGSSGADGARQRAARRSGSDADAPAVGFAPTSSPEIVDPAPVLARPREKGTAFAIRSERMTLQRETMVSPPGFEPGTC